MSFGWEGAGGSFADALRQAREVLERAEQDARKQASEIVQRAEEQAQRISEDAEKQATTRAAEIVRQAERRARVIPQESEERVVELIKQIDSAYTQLDEIRLSVSALLRESQLRGDVPGHLRPPAPAMVPANSAVSPAPPRPEPPGRPAVAAAEPPSPVGEPVQPWGGIPAGESSTNIDEIDLPPPPRRPGAQTIVRGLRAVVLDEEGNLAPGSGQALPAPEAGSTPNTPGETSAEPSREASEPPKRRWPFG